MNKFAVLMSHRFCTLTASSSKVLYSISSIELDLHSTVNKKKKEYIYFFNNASYCGKTIYKCACAQ